MIANLQSSDLGKLSRIGVFLGGGQQNIQAVIIPMPDQTGCNRLQHRIQPQLREWNCGIQIIPENVCVC